VITKIKRSGLLATTAFCSAVVSTLALAPVAAQAQDAETKEEAKADAVTEVVVTGSRIRSRDYKAISPVSTVTSETIALTATQSAERLLNDLPQITPGNTYTSNNTGGEDFPTLDLRGLSPTRTLVLVNGERVPGSSTTGAVDISTIPPALIDKVEIVTGGASAVYGSDAIAGVVNFVLKKNYEGAETNISYGSAFNKGHAAEVNWDGIIGGNFAEDRGNVTAYVGYYERKKVWQSEYDYSKQSSGVLGYYLNDDSGPSGTCVYGTSADYLNCVSGTPSGSYAYNVISGGSATPPWGSFTITGVNWATLKSNPATSGQFNNVDSDCNSATAGANPTSGSAFSFNADGKLTPSFTGGACRAADRGAGSSRYNFAPNNLLVLPAKRYTFNTTFNYELTPRARLHGMVSYVRSESQVQLAPTPATGLTVKLTPAMQSLIQTDHPDLWVALQSRANPLADFQASYRTNQLGNRIGTNTNNSFFFLTGLEGDFNDNWDYSVTVSYGLNQFSGKLENNAGKTQFTQGLAGCQNADGTALTGMLPGCVPLDIFGQGKLSADAINFLGVDVTSSTEVKESRLSAFTRGDLFTLPAGPVSAVFGYEYRESSADLTVDDAQKNGDLYGFNAVQGQKGRISVNEVYTELAVPIVKDLPWAYSANIEAGYRSSNYSTVGSVETYKVGADYSPVSWLRFRAAHNKAVRAPNVFELFQNGDQGFPSYTDPCNDTPVRTSSMAAFCQTQGLPASAITGFNQSNAQVQAFAYGNPDLKPETAKSDTIGVVFQPDWFTYGTLRATVDYYKIRVDDAVASRGAQTIINSCYSNMGSTAQSAQDCARIQRDAVTGQMIGVDTSRGNLTFFETEGYDVNVEWSKNVFGGTLRVNEAISFLESWNSGGTELKGTTEAAIGSATPDYKSVLSATFKKGPLTYFARWTYVPPMKQDAPGLTFEGTGAPDTPEATYLDASVKWDINSSVSLTTNISNLFDELPPVTETGVVNNQANTDTQTYRVLGRSFNVALKYKF